MNTTENVRYNNIILCRGAVRATPENIIVTNWNARTRPPTGVWAFYV